MKNMTRLMFVCMGFGLFFTPLLAVAQDSNQPPNNHTVENLIWGIVPVLIILSFLWLLIRWVIKQNQSSPLALRQRAYLDRHEQHMQRVEQLLERIAVALEQRKPQ